jgi:hypothetical protein
MSKNSQGTNQYQTRGTSAVPQTPVLDVSSVLSMADSDCHDPDCIDHDHAEPEIDYSIVCNRPHSQDEKGRYWHYEENGPFMILEDNCKMVMAYNDALAVVKAVNEQSEGYTPEIDLSDIEDGHISVKITHNETGNTNNRRVI